MVTTTARSRRLPAYSPLFYVLAFLLSVLVVLAALALYSALTTGSGTGTGHTGPLPIIRPTQVSK